MKLYREENGQVVEQIEKTDVVLLYIYIVFGIIAFLMLLTMGYLVYSIFS
jgi:hypothetical protein